MVHILITENQLVEILNEFTDRQSKAFDKWFDKINGDETERDVLKKVFFKMLKRLQKKDIFQYKSIEELKMVLQNVQDSIPTMKKIKMAEEGVDYLTILNNEDVRIIVPTTHAGSCKYGLDTKWCTANIKFPIYFETYKNDGFLYRIIYKKEKVQRKYKEGGKEIVKNSNEKYSLFISITGQQKLIDANDIPVEFEDMPFFNDEMENAIVKHYEKHIENFKDISILDKWL